MKTKGGKAKEFNIILTVNQHLFSPLIVAAFGTLLLELVSYPGFLLNHTGIPATFFLLASVISYCVLLFQSNFFDQKLVPEAELVLRCNLISLPFLLLMYFMFSQMEKAHYLNYVFSTFHIHLVILERIVVFTIFLSLLYVFSQITFKKLSLLKSVKKSDPGYSYREKPIGPLVFFVTMLLLLAIQSYTIFEVVSDDLASILRTPFASFEDRKIQKFGGPYRTYKFIIRHTEPNSVIAVPPQFVWGIVGNIGFSRYFLYPRFLVHPEDFTDADMPRIDYVIIGESIPITGTNTYKFWPTTPIPADSIYVFDELNQIEEKIEKTFYDPSDTVYKGKWGIIKVPASVKVTSGEYPAPTR